MAAPIPPAPCPRAGRGGARRPPAWRLSAALGAVGVAAFVGAGVLADAPRHLDDAGRTPPARSAAPAWPRSAPGAIPVRLRLPGRVDAPIVPVAADRGGTLAPPAQPTAVGWWLAGGAPGERSGTVLIAGHVDSARYGLGAFAALWGTPVGAQVEVSGADGHGYGYRVVARRTYPRSDLPADLFSPDGTPRLALVTCAGGYDRTARHYQQNLVLYAIPVNPTARQP